MATIKKFEDLKIWQEARALCQLIIKLTNYDAFKYDFKLKYQIRSSTGSVMDNIAEGFERGGDKEFRQFCSIAKGSSGEARSQSYRCFDSGYISKDENEDLIDRTTSISEKLNKLMAYLSRSDYKGNKFKEPRASYGPEYIEDLDASIINEITENPNFETSDFRPWTSDKQKD